MDDPFAGYPRLHEIVAAGIPLPTAIPLWNRMAAELRLGKEFWWDEVKRVAAQFGETLQ